VESEQAVQMQKVNLDLVDLARAAAEQKDPVGMLEALWASNLHTGLVRRVAVQYPSLDPDDCHTVVADAIDTFYETLTQAPGTVRNPQAWLFKVALNKAYRLHDQRSRTVSLSEDGEEPIFKSGEGGNSRHPGALRTEALRLARSFLPQLGQENLQRVMSYYFDAIEKGVQDLSIAEVAEALHLTVSTTKQCAHRGFQRLKRMAQARGIRIEDFSEALDCEDKNEDEG
jgi:DNA-directed RNA polymerase specialized sigma24 family protein